tara:strand:+ start:192 stop:1541 length:1350 start_codon:yes stop_codon:yes gene_type:complete
MSIKKIFSPIILFLSLSLFFYTFYKSEFYWDGGRRSYYFFYYFLSIIFIFFSIITFFINQKIKEYLIISCISLVISLYLFEGYLNIPNQFPNDKLYEKLSGNKWDKRSKLEVYKDLKKENVEITVTTSPYYFLNKKYDRKSDILTLAGVSNTKTIYCNENGYYSIYQSDRYGFNNPDTEWNKKKIEYLLIGDSFVHGACVNRPNDISSVLRTKYNKSTLNLGYGGNDSLIQYATLREYLNSNVKKVIWVFYEGNDLDEKTMMSFKNNILHQYVQNLSFTQNLKYKQFEIDIFLKKEIDLILKKKTSEKREFNLTTELKKFIKLSKVRATINLFLPKKYQPRFAEISSQKKLEEFKEILTLTNKLVNEKNSKLYFVYLPEYERYVFNYDNTNYYNVKNIIDDLKIPFIDIHKEVFEKEQNPLRLFPFNSVGHYNAEGYKKVAETINQLTN